MNVKFENHTYYVRSGHKLAVNEEGQVFSFPIDEELDDSLVELKPSLELVEPVEEFVVKMIDNAPVFTEPNQSSHAATVLRIGDLPKVDGESAEFYRLANGGFVEKSKCRKYSSFR